MSKMRTRGSLALFGDVDDLFGIAAASSSARDAEDLSVDGDVDSSPLHSVLSDDFTRGASSAQKRQRVSPSARDATPSSLSGSPTTTGESLGGDEIDLLRRKDEERADMALFLAKAVAETSSLPPLRELVKFLEQTGMPRVLLALKRGAFTEAFLHALATARPRPAHRVLLLCLLVKCMAYVSLDAFFQSSVVAFLVDSLIPLDASAQASASSPSPVRAAAAHWSTRPKRAADFAVQTNELPLVAEEEAALHTRVEALCPSVHAAGLSCSASNSGSNSAALALHALLRLVFEYNRSLLVVSPSSFSVPLAIVRAGGLEHLCSCLRDSAARAASLSFLEVLTASDVLRREKVRLLGLVPVLIELLDSTDSVAASATAASVLKVLTDITNLIPSALSDTNTVDRFVTYMRGVLSVPASEAEVDERETFVLCCAINVVLHEAREGASAVMLEPPAFTQAVVADGALLPTLAASMTARYHRTESEQLVLSGYAALLLAALSLVVVDEDGGTLRVPVITAVAAASRGTRIGTLTDRQPMRMVAAIIQEFLLFQSASGTLTKEALLEMDALVARLRQHNQISLTAPAVDEEEAKEEEVTLGDIL